MQKADTRQSELNVSRKEKSPSLIKWYTAKTAIPMAEYVIIFVLNFYR